MKYIKKNESSYNPLTDTVTYECQINILFEGFKETNLSCSFIYSKYEPIQKN